LGAALELGDEPKRRALPEEPALRLDTLVARLVAARNQPVLLMLDEAQAVAESSEGANIMASLRAVLQKRQRDVLAVFTGSSQDALAAMMAGSGGPMYQFAQLLNFPVLGDDYLNLLAQHFSRVQDHGGTKGIRAGGRAPDAWVTNGGETCRLFNLYRRGMWILFAWVFTDEDVSAAAAALNSGYSPAEMYWIDCSMSGVTRDAGAWTLRDNARFASLPLGISIRTIPADATLSGMLIQGDIDAIISPRAPSCMASHPHLVGRLFTDYRTAEEDYFRVTKLFPLMHAVGIVKDSTRKLMYKAPRQVP
jgi:hypothetical protein